MERVWLVPAVILALTLVTRAPAHGQGASCTFDGECAAGQFCEFPAGQCGPPGPAGTCVLVPSACPDVFQPVCGCDGITYSNDCFRLAGRVSLDHPGPCELAVSIDIKPGSFPNSIAPGQKGVIPVAILTTASFDATTVNPATVRFGATGTEAAPLRSVLADVDKDGDTDLLLHFNAQATAIACGATYAFLTGETFGGQPIMGVDAIQTVGCK